MDKTKFAAVAGKFVKTTLLKILHMEDDSSENTKLVKVTFAEKITAIGSNVTDAGAEMKYSQDHAWLQGNIDGTEVDSDFNKLVEGLEEKNGVLEYKGPLKMDVSKPKSRIVNGVPTVTTPPKLWIVSVNFSRRGRGLREEQAKGLSTVLKDFFGAGKDPVTGAPVDKKREIVDTQ